MTAVNQEGLRPFLIAAEAVAALRFNPDEDFFPTYECSVTVYGIAQRIIHLAKTLYELTDSGEITFPADPSVSAEALEFALARQGLNTTIAYMTEVESYMAAEIHAGGSTLVGWPLSPPPGPTGWTAEGQIIHAVHSEEVARDLYMTALTHELHREGFFDALVDSISSETRA